MEQKKQDNGPLIAPKEMAAAVTATAIVATQSIVVPPTASALTLLAWAIAGNMILPPVAAAITEVAHRHRLAKAERFFHELLRSYAENEDVTPEEVAGRLESMKDNLNVSDAILRSVRAVMDNPCDSAVTALALLSARYAREGRAADSFFRGAVRLLSDISEGDLHELRRLAQATLGETKREFVVFRLRNRTDVEATLRARSAPEGKQKVVTVVRDAFADVDTAGDYREEHACFLETTDLRVLFAQLNAAALAFPGRTSYNGQGPPEIEVGRDVLEQLYAILPSS